MLKKKLSGPKIRYERQKEKTLPSLLLFLRLSLPKPIWKRVVHVWYQNDGKTACALSVHSRFGAFGLIPNLVPSSGHEID